jgi:hypothetical protein
MTKQWAVLVGLAAAAALAVPVLAADFPSPAAPGEAARPGTVNYVEGAAYLDGSPLSRRSIGSAELDAGHMLTTGNGKAEVLLTPGIFLRVDSNSSVKMISPDLAQTQVALETGRAGVEVDQIFPQNEVQIVDGGVTTQLIKPGYYEFNAAGPRVMVFNGRAEVEVGDNKWEAVKDHHEMALVAGQREKTADFDARPANDELYNWSSLRSQYLAEANNQIAGEYAYGPGVYPGWYWNSGLWGYTFVGPGLYYSPFGWGFYPWGGFYGGWGWYGHGFYGHPFYGGHFAGGGFYGGGFHGGGFGGRR